MKLAATLITNIFNCESVFLLEAKLKLRQKIRKYTEILFTVEFKDDN
jgi:hypothetical protein